MEDTQKDFINIINSSVRNRRCKVDNKSVNWVNIIEKSKTNKVEALIYSSLNQDSKRYIDNRSLTLWRQDAFCTSMTQRKNMNNTLEVLNRLNDEGVEVICLKGLITRELYPTPEMRTMKDSNLLIKDKNEFKLVKKILMQLGFNRIGGSEECLIFKNEANTIIDIRTSICYEYIGKNKLLELQKSIWNSKRNISINGIQTFALSWGDMLINVLLQMVSGIRNNLFMLTQLLDIVLIIENKYDDINWRNFHYKIKTLRLEKITFAIFNLCNNYFEMDIPINEDLNINEYNKYGDMLLEKMLNNKIEVKEDKKGISFIARIYSIIFKKKQEVNANVSSNNNEIVRWLEI